MYLFIEAFIHVSISTILSQTFLGR